MYTFLLGASINTDSLLNIQRSMQATKKLFDSFGFHTVTSEKFIPEMNVRWFCLTPEVDNKVNLISEYSNERVVVLVFGHIYAVDSTNQSAASVVFETWERWGIDAVRSLDGCFSAVIIDLRKRIIYIVSDIIGKRSLRMFHNKHTLLVSSHDIPIIATGLCAAEIDPVSVGGAVLFDWSLGGKSILKDITVCSPFDYYTWCNGVFDRTHKPLLRTDQRIEASDKIGTKRQVDLMIETMRKNIRYFCGDNPNVYVELTAGIDSRVILAILLSVIDSSRVTAVTAGHKFSLDVKIARVLADKCNISHEYSVPCFPEKNIFLNNARILAFLMNGDTNGKRALTGCYSYDATPKLGGNSGEIFSGAFYNYLYGKNDLFDIGSFFEFLQKILSGGNKFPWKDKYIPESISRRVGSIINLYREMCSEEYDILDFFYLYERCARWGAMNEHFTWIPNKFSPFESPELVRLAFKLPPPIGYHYLFHRTIVKRFLPVSKYLLINEKSIMPLLSHSYYARLLSDIIRCSMYYKRKAVYYFSSNGELHDHEQIRSEIFSRLLSDDTRDILLAEKSIGCEIFEKKSLVEIIDDHIAGKRNNLNVIGNLIGIESFRLLINDVITERKFTVEP